MLVDADDEEEEHENIAFQENINEQNSDPTNNTIKHSFTNNKKDLPQLFFPSEVIKSVFF